MRVRLCVCRLAHPDLAPNERNGADRGIDGRGWMLDKPRDRDSRLVLAQVKGGRAFQLGQFRDFLHVVEREDAALGVYVTLDPVTSGQARAEAAGMGDVTLGAERYPRVQLWSIDDFFAGRRPIPPPSPTRTPASRCSPACWRDAA